MKELLKATALSCGTLGGVDDRTLGVFQLPKHKHARAGCNAPINGKPHLPQYRHNYMWGFDLNFASEAGQLI